MAKNMIGEAKITLKATLVTDPTKNTLVCVKIGDTMRNLQVIIGESMKLHFPDTFEALDGVRAFNISLDKEK